MLHCQDSIHLPTVQGLLSLVKLRFQEVTQVLTAQALKIHGTPQSQEVDQTLTVLALKTPDIVQS